MVAKSKPDIGDDLSEVAGPAQPLRAASDAGGSRGAKRALPVMLPTSRTAPADGLDGKMIMVYGPNGIGKSTLASEFGQVLFLETEPGLSMLDVYRLPITSWEEFCLAVNAIRDEAHDFDWVCIDTADMLARLCSEHSNSDLGVVHESDLEWGKGWSVSSGRLIRWTSKLAAIAPGLLVISHAQPKEIKTRNSSYEKMLPTLNTAARRSFSDLADIVLYIDNAEIDGEEVRTIHTKPTTRWEAKERGSVPRLPDQIPWPIGENGYELLLRHWKDGHA